MLLLSRSYLFALSKRTFKDNERRDMPRDNICTRRIAFCCLNRSLRVIAIYDHYKERNYCSLYRCGAGIIINDLVAILAQAIKAQAICVFPHLPVDLLS